MRRVPSPWRLLIIVVSVLVALMAAGCVRVPTSGPVEQVPREEPDCQNCLTVQVNPPAYGDDPQAIVAGYLRATSNYQPNYSVAKQFLTEAAAQTWSPEARVSIYSGTPVARGRRVVLDGRLHGTLGRDRTYTARDEHLLIDFGVVEEKGQWRISRPPPGLLVADYAFTSFYRPYNLYFLGQNATLVPDPIYLPDLRSQAGVASVLMKALLGGPSAWLAPAAGTAIPEDTALSVDSVTVADGIATVPLSDPVLQLKDEQRTQMAAQVISTLKQATGITGVAFTVNQSPLRIPGSDPDTGVLTIDAVSPDVEPVPYVSSGELYAVRNGKVETVAESAGAAAPQPVPGRLGEGRVAVDSLAVSVANTDLAVVSDRRTRLRVSTIPAGELTTVLEGVTQLLRPQYTRFGELWVVGESAGRQRMWVFAGGRPTEVPAPVLGGSIRAFKVSPDGSRIALVRQVGSSSELGLARISRTEGIKVDGWRPLNLTRTETPQLRYLRDVSWIDATDLIVLGGTSPRASFLPYRVSQDASTVTQEGDTTAWEAESLTTLPRSGTTVVVTTSGQAWRDDSTQWVAFLDKVTAAAFPG